MPAPLPRDEAEAPADFDLAVLGRGLPPEAERLIAAAGLVRSDRAQAEPSGSRDIRVGVVTHEHGGVRRTPESIHHVQKSLRCRFTLNTSVLTGIDDGIHQ